MVPRAFRPAPAPGLTVKTFSTLSLLAAIVALAVVALLLLVKYLTLD